MPIFRRRSHSIKKEQKEKEREFRKQRTKAAQSDLSNAILEYRNLYYRKKKLFFDENLRDISKAPDRKKFQILNSLLGKGYKTKLPEFYERKRPS